MTDTNAMTIELRQGCQTADRLSILDALMTTNAPAGQPSHHMPPVISRAQAYYWSRTWQADEQESLDDIALGNVREFSDASEAIRWLLGSLARRRRA